MKDIKLLLTALVVSVGFAGPLLAESHVMDLGVESVGMHVTIAVVNADSAGTLMIYDYHVGAQGDLLGETPVNAGANADVRVQLTIRPQGNLLAVLVNEAGDTVAQSVIDLP